VGFGGTSVARLLLLKEMKKEYSKPSIERDELMHTSAICIGSGPIGGGGTNGGDSGNSFPG